MVHNLSSRHNVLIENYFWRRSPLLRAERINEEITDIFSTHFFSIGKLTTFFAYINEKAYIYVISEPVYASNKILQAFYFITYTSPLSIYCHLHFDIKWI